MVYKVLVGFWLFLKVLEGVELYFIFTGWLGMTFNVVDGKTWYGTILDDILNGIGY